MEFPLPRDVMPLAPERTPLPRIPLGAPGLEPVLLCYLRRVFKGQKEQKHRLIGSHLGAPNAIKVKRLLSLRKKVRGNSTKMLKVLSKHPDLAEFSARIE